MLKLIQHSCREIVNCSKLGRINVIGFGRYSSSTVSSSLEKTTEETTEQESSHKNETEDGKREEQRRTAYRNESEENFAPFRFVYPEFLPDPNMKFRNRIREKLERMDMLKRRSNFEIPEFYVGSYLKVTVSDRNAPGKASTFVGLCTERDGTGLRSTFTLRNVVDGHGVEITYDLYNPTILNIICLRLEKRLDENLRYLRDCAPEYSTVPFDMVPELRNPDTPVPINPVKVKLNPPPWIAKWHLWLLQGVEDYGPLEKWQVKKFNTWKFLRGLDTEDYDLMKQYRTTIPAEEQTEIYSEIHQQLDRMTASLRKQKKKRAFIKPQKTV